ncbi:MAG: adenylate cyclase [Pyrinomonadaceae bacterium]|nr:adenylate cyclase [Pyrinomonadaceae bacterium]
MKTDIRGFTTKVGMLSELDLSTLLKQHKQFILDIAAKHSGGIVKGEGDSFWMTFPSVTAASLAASEIQEELRAAQAGSGDHARLAVRIAITLGDVLHQEKDIFGESVNLAARIESVTPPDEIYLSQAAWLALNKAEIRTSYVGEFTLKGITETQSIYKLDQKHRTRIIKDQVIVFSDLHGYNSYAESHPIEDVERLLIHLELLHNQVCEAYGGTIRMVLGDALFFTFPEASLALAAIEHLCDEWDGFIQKNQALCSMMIGSHKGDLYQFRSFLYGKDINDASRLQNLTREVSSLERSYALVSSRVKDEVIGSVWENRLREIELPESSSTAKQIGDRPIYEFVR